MMKSHLKIAPVILIFLFLAACGYAPEETQPAQTLQADVPTSTATPKPSLTPRPTKTPSPTPTVTNTPWPTKEVLAQFGEFGGDGGWGYYAFIGGQMPKWILYTDGQLILKKEDVNGVWFEETTLTTSQLCSFLSQVEKTGFFTLPFDDSSTSLAGIPTANPVYQFDSTTQFSEGGSYFVLQVNGSRYRQLNIYSHYVQYLIPDADRVLTFFDNYSRPSTRTSYQAQYMLLRIEEAPDDLLNSTAAPNIEPWPADFPSLDLLMKGNNETIASYYLSNKVSLVLVTGDRIKPVFETFGNRLAYKLFQSGDHLYDVAARPLLPHETLYAFSVFPHEKEFDLPFVCSN